VCAAAALLTGCASALPDTHDADVQAIRDTEAAWVKDAATRNVDKFAAHYSDDAELLLPNRPKIVGKDAIRAAFEPIVTDPNFALIFQSTKVDTARSGELGYSEGTYTLTATNPVTNQAATEKGKYVCVFRREADGSWKAVADTINADAPPPLTTATK
jgi:uncharacterized protein (TIGR02246 family)